jgi:hypothetical protein
LADVVAPDEGTFLFFFGGHGYTYKGTNYLATFGVSADDLDGEGLAVKDVEQLLLDSKAKRKLLFVDACRNDPGQAARAAGQRSFEKLQAAEGLRVLYSTKEGRVSYEDDVLRQGIFSYYVAKGLAGEAAGKDGLVTFRDLADYVTDEMRAYTVPHGQVQIPFESGESSGDFLLSAGSVKGGSVPSLPAPVNTNSTPSPSAASLSVPANVDLKQLLSFSYAGGRLVYKTVMTATCSIEQEEEHFVNPGAHKNGDLQVIFKASLNAIEPSSLEMLSPTSGGPIVVYRLSRDGATTVIMNKWRSGTWRKEIESNATPGAPAVPVNTGGAAPFSFALPPDNPAHAFSVLKQAVDACHSQ